MRVKTIKVFLATFVVCLYLAPSAFGHPMGNFSVNHYSGLDIQNERILIRYFIDLAEIPTYQELQEANLTAAPNVPLDPNAAPMAQYIAIRGRELANGLSLALDGKSLPLRLISSSVIFPPGAGGLPTMKMGFVYEAILPSHAGPQPVNLHYSDNNYQGHSGWKEIIASSAADSLTRSSVPVKDRSAELSNYPTDLLSSPPQDVDASLEVKLSPQSDLDPSTKPKVAEGVSSRPTRVVAIVPDVPSRATIRPSDGLRSALPPAISQTTQPRQSAQPAMQLRANQQLTPRNRFTELIAVQHLSPWFLFLGVLISMGLGALHALEPGHGKTIVAAYLVGSRGTGRHAVLLGIIVTASHTAGVFALGAITLFASRYIVPEQLYPWLGVFSGISIAVLGCYMFLRRWTGIEVDHSHVDGSSHLSAFFSKRRTGESSQPDTVAQKGAAEKGVTLTQLFTLGVTGGIVPCPAALIVLLSAFALHRMALGFVLIVAFSVGLAAVLIGFGMLIVYARRFMSHLQIDGPLTKRWLPLASSAFVSILGAGLAIQAFATIHFNAPLLTKERIGPLLFVTGLGLILGMRHSTDADHVVAISTIVTKQKSIRGAALIGSVWGLGHTITIFVVGSLIILYGVTIPPRIGLSMEFSVALMLILLGILNLTGVMQTITTYFTPAKEGSSYTVGTATTVIPLKKRQNWIKTSTASVGLYQIVRPLAIGLVHGLAGSAAVALLVLSTIHNPYWATAYLVIFGIGTMVGMMCMTTAIAVPLTYAADRFGKLSRYVAVASGLVSVCFGLFLVYQLGFLGGLFTSHPQWTPQ